ncbi:MAG: hypothetical protein AB7V32_03490, partial [Candidatus Berkiella sp.]
FNATDHAPTQANLQMMQALIPYVKREDDDSIEKAYPYLTTPQLVDRLNRGQSEPQDAQSDERKLKILGLLLKHELIEGVESIVPGSHALSFDNPSTGAPYDLYAYLMDNPALQAGFLKPQRDTQLLGLYALTKGLMAKETRSEEVIEKVRAREAFVQTREDGTKVAYNRYDLKQQHQNLPSDVRATLLSFVYPQAGLTQKQQYVTAKKLGKFARAQLGDAAIEKVTSHKPALS